MLKLWFKGQLKTGRRYFGQIQRNSKFSRLNDGHIKEFKSILGSQPQVVIEDPQEVGKSANTFLVKNSYLAFIVFESWLN